MTGNPAAPSPRRKIQALTVSVNYADYLESIAPNRKHFERWLVVTDESDIQTQEVCRRFDMDILFSKRLYENGAAFNKAAALNEGLSVLDQDAWVAVMDSDILLPHDFRGRLDAQPLDPHCLYGLAGRRVCPTLAEFAALAEREPWADNLIYTTFVIGYFNLFHLSQQHNRYPEDTSDDASTYDLIFSDLYPAARRRYLPFVCLHAGDTTQNWRGRTTDPFLNGPALRPAHANSTEEIAVLFGGPGTHAVQMGCFRGEPGGTLARHFDRVTVIDHWGLTARAVSQPMEIDLNILCARYREETAGLSNVTPPLEHSDEVLTAIPDRSVDLLWLTAEPEYDFLLKLLPAWLKKLKPGGGIAGGFHDPELLPGPSRLIHLLLGAPDQSFPDMQWVKRIADPESFLQRLLPPPAPHTERGVVYVASGEPDVESLLVSLHSLQRHWQGPVCVINAGDESPSLCLACARLGVMFRNVPDADLPELTYVQALAWSPFRETVCLDCATLVREPLDWLFAPLAQAPFAFCSGTGKTAVGTAAFAWRSDSSIVETWHSLSAALIFIAGPDAVLLAITQLVQDSGQPLLAAENIWSGPAKRIPSGARVAAFPRLARAGALHLYAPWAEEEQEMLQRLQAPV